MSASKYYQKMIGLVDTMANIGHHMTNEEVISHIHPGLGPSHEDLFNIITVISNQQSVMLSKFYSYFIAHETQPMAMNRPTYFTSSTTTIILPITTIIKLTIVIVVLTVVKGVVMEDIMVEVHVSKYVVFHIIMC